MTTNRTSSPLITKLNDNEIFVFGSNLAGRHGKGAAKMATQFGAKYGCNFGKWGSTFAIPTKDYKLKPLPLHTISEYIIKFCYYAKDHTELNFLVTEIGCGLAGYTPGDIAPLFELAYELNNVYLPKSFWNEFKNHK